MHDKIKLGMYTTGILLSKRMHNLEKAQSNLKITQNRYTLNK